MKSRSVVNDFHGEYMCRYLCEKGELPQRIIASRLKPDIIGNVYKDDKMFVLLADNKWYGYEEGFVGSRQKCIDCYNAIRRKKGEEQFIK